MELESAGLETLAPWKARQEAKVDVPVRLQSEFKAKGSNFESL